MAILNWMHGTGWGLDWIEWSNSPGQKLVFDTCLVFVFGTYILCNLIANSHSNVILFEMVVLLRKFMVLSELDWQFYTGDIVVCQIIFYVRGGVEKEYKG